MARENAARVFSGARAEAPRWPRIKGGIDMPPHYPFFNYSWIEGAEDCGCEPRKRETKNFCSVGLHAGQRFLRRIANDFSQRDINSSIFHLNAGAHRNPSIVVRDPD